MVIKLAGFAALTAAFGVFTVVMVNQLASVDGLLPTLDPAVLEGLNILPANTTTYIVICGASRVAQFTFVAVAKAVKALT